MSTLTVPVAWTDFTNDAKDDAEPYCPVCDHDLEEGDVYCRECGTKLIWPEDEYPELPLQDYSKEGWRINKVPRYKVIDVHFRMVIETDDEETQRTIEKAVNTLQPLCASDLSRMTLSAEGHDVIVGDPFIDMEDNS